MLRVVLFCFGLGALAAAGVAVAAEPAAPLTLERAITLALARDERAKVADEQRVQGEARVDRARALFFPDLTLTGQYTLRGRQSQFQDQNAFSGTATVSLSLFDGRARPLYRQALRERDATRLESAEAKRQLAFEVADAYLQTLGLERVVEAAQRRADLARQSLADAQGRASAQLASSNDVTRAELELATAERELARSRADLDRARLALGYLVGEDVALPLAAPDALLAEAAAPPAANVDTLVAQARSRRLDVAARVKRAEALDFAADEPRGRFWPSLALTGQARASSEEGFAGANTDWFLGVTLTWNVWDGGERAAEAEALDAAARIGDLDAAAASRRVDLEVRQALAQLGTAREVVAQAEAAVAAARKNAEETAILYRRGLARAIEVVDAAAALFDAEVALARESYGLGLALLDLRAALGLDPLGKEISL
jgi:outer membrane protein TolC